MEDMWGVHIWKTMDILEQISNEGKLVQVLCHFAHIELSHIERQFYIQNKQNCNQLQIKSIVWSAECCEKIDPYKISFFPYKIIKDKVKKCKFNITIMIFINTISGVLIKNSIKPIVCNVDKIIKAKAYQFIFLTNFFDCYLLIYNSTQNSVENFSLGLHVLTRRTKLHTRLLTRRPGAPGCLPADLKNSPIE